MDGVFPTLLLAYSIINVPYNSGRSMCHLRHLDLNLLSWIYEVVKRSERRIRSWKRYSSLVRFIFFSKFNSRRVSERPRLDTVRSFWATWHRFVVLGVSDDYPYPRIKEKDEETSVFWHNQYGTRCPRVCDLGTWDYSRSWSFSPSPNDVTVLTRLIFLRKYLVT